MVPFRKGADGWSLASHVSHCVLKHLCVSDHPVCGASVASRLFIDAAATPPYKAYKEGNAPTMNSLVISLSPADDFQHVGIVIGPGLNVCRLFDVRPAFVLLQRSQVSRMASRNDIIRAGFSGGFFVIVVTDEAFE